MVNGSAGLSISSKYIKKLKGTTSWTSKEYKAIQRGKVFSGMSEDALLCAFPNLELELKTCSGLYTSRLQEIVSMISTLTITVSFLWLRGLILACN